MLFLIFVVMTSMLSAKGFMNDKLHLCVKAEKSQFKYGSADKENKFRAKSSSHSLYYSSKSFISCWQIDNHISGISSNHFALLSLNQFVGWRPHFSFVSRLFIIYVGHSCLTYQCLKFHSPHCYHYCEIYCVVNPLLGIFMN
jgi:hypothetical protein